MIRSAYALATACLLATAVRAAAPKAPKASAAPPTSTAPAAPAATTAPAATSAPAVAAAPSPRLGWANIGIYDVRFSTPFGTYTDAEFGLGGGAAVNVAQLAPDVPLAAFANVAISFGSGGQFFPLTAGVAVRYDKLPVQLLGGLGLTIVPNSAGTNTGIGAGILLMGLYPLPQVDPRLSAQAQIQYHLLTQSLSLLEFLIGAGYSL